MANMAGDSLRSEDADEMNSHPTVYAKLRQKLEASGNIPAEQLHTMITAEMLDQIEASSFSQSNIYHQELSDV